MSEFHPETILCLAPARRVTGDMAEIACINREFLRVLTHPDTSGSPQVLGLDTSTVGALRKLSREQLDGVAGTPLLLAEFSPVPGITAMPSGVVRELAYAQAGARWEGELHAFADRLLTCVWQAARRDKLLATFCIGLDRTALSDLAKLSFAAIGRCSGELVCCLRARLARHPNFWPDLIRSARSDDPVRRTASQLAVIQLSIGQHRRVGTNARQTGYH